jgi:hypothetical protein
MKHFLIILSLIVLSMVTVTGIAKSKDDLPEYTVEGLQRIHNPKHMAVVYAEPGADLVQYKRIYLVEPYVAFKKNWKRDQNRSISQRVRTSDMEKIKVSVKDLFMEVFTKELEKGGYELADERAEDVLIVKPAIIDLNVNAPDIATSGMTRTFTESAGSMTLYMELYDSETDDLLAKAIDKKADRGHGWMEWQTRVTNIAAGKRMMQPWAEALRQALDEAREATSQSKE